MAKEPINRDLITRLLKEGATGKQRDIYDDQINGFGVLIMPRGKKPAFELVLEQIRCTYLSTESTNGAWPTRRPWTCLPWGQYLDVDYRTY